MPQLRENLFQCKCLVLDGNHSNDAINLIIRVGSNFSMKKKKIELLHTLTLSAMVLKYGTEIGKEQTHYN